MQHLTEMSLMVIARKHPQEFLDVLARSPKNHVLATRCSSVTRHVKSKRWCHAGEIGIASTVAQAH